MPGAMARVIFMQHLGKPSNIFITRIETNYTNFNTKGEEKIGPFLKPVQSFALPQFV